jgi:Ni/Co efflux regulator RcnB
MTKQSLIVCAMAAVLALAGCATSVHDGRRQYDRFDDHDRQVTQDWYNDHRIHEGGKFRYTDRFSAEEESQFREGTVFDDGHRRRARAAPKELTRQLPRPPRNHRYVEIAGHVVLVDQTNHVKAIIHLHDDQASVLNERP